MNFLFPNPTILRRLTGPCALVLFVLASIVPAAAEEAKPNLALVELFTSEGCSSCPSADKLVSTLHRTQPFLPLARVVALAFHVDYWDNLGWKDPFGNPDYTQRQRAYAAIQKESKVYTPQMVVNGVHGFVGSDREKARVAVHDVHSRAPETLKLSAKKDEDGKAWTVEVVSGVPAGADLVLWVALAEDDLVSEITRGENKGKTLVHQAVVRSFTRYDISKTDEVKSPYIATVPWNADFKAANCRIVAGIQSEKSGALLALGDRVLGASE